MKKKNYFSPISSKAMDSFRKYAPEVIEKTVQVAMEREDEVIQHGDQCENILTSGMQFTTKMLESALLTGEISLLEDELKWAKDRLPHDGVAMEHVLVRLKIYREEVIKILPTEDASEIISFIDWMIKWQENQLKEEFNEK